MYRGRSNPSHTSPLTKSRRGQVADDPKNNLNDEQRKLVEVWLETHWTTSKACPISGHTDWSVSDHVVQPMTHLPVGTLALGGAASYPGILVICRGCGYTMTFNAVIMGLFTTQMKVKEQVKEAVDAQA
jgi:hypothetical protein